MIIIQPLEIAREDNSPTGKWRLTSRSDETNPPEIHGLCDHEHDTPEEAAACPEAKLRSGRSGLDLPARWKLSDSSATRIVDVVTGALIADLAGLLDAEENARHIVAHSPLGPPPPDKECASPANEA